MAKEREGIDFEWRTSKGSNVKTRHFFTAAEKKARAGASAPSTTKAKAQEAPKKPATAESKPKATSSAPSTTPRPKARPTASTSTSYAPAGKTTTKRSEEPLKAPKKAEVSSGRGRGVDEVVTRRKQNPKEYTYEEWRGMSRGERERAGLPVSELGGQLGFSRFKTGLTGKGYTMQGYSKGGMTKGKK